MTMHHCVEFIAHVMAIILIEKQVFIESFSFDNNDRGFI